MVLPGIIPRLRAFAEEGFGWLALLMAFTYQGARLLPSSHPYCNPANKGRFGIRHVIAEAANHLVIKRENIDQIIVFIALLAGFVILVAQFFLLVGGFIIKQAFAGTPAPFDGMFNTAAPETDIALLLLAHVFGVPGMFCNAAGSACTAIEGTLPTAFHQGLHSLLHFYNLALLLVGVIILLYYIVVVVAETAHTGTPFGRRFSHIWAPIRLVVAVGLLVPINYGLNSAQYMTLFSARMGSGFATNAWLQFNRGLANATGLENAALIARTTAPDAQYMMKFMMLVQACRHGYRRATGDGLGGPGPAGTPTAEPIIIEPYFVSGDDFYRIPETMSGAAAWQQGNEFYNNNDIIIRFGHQDHQMFPNETGGVKPFCWEITVHKVDSTQPMPRMIAEQYMAMVLFLWNSPINRAFGARAAELSLFKEPKLECNGDVDNLLPQPCDSLPPHEFKQQRMAQNQQMIEAQVNSAWANHRGSGSYTTPQELLDRGWGGAGIWYNRIAQWNGAWIGAVRNLPSPSKYPSAMEQVQSARRGAVANIDHKDRFNPTVEGQKIVFERLEEEYIASMLNDTYLYWEEESATEPTDVRDSSNPVINFINMIFGIDGLFTIRNNHDIHPLAQLVALGKGIVDASVRNLMIAVGASAIAGGFEAAVGSGIPGAIFGGISSMMSALAMVGLTVGFILFYILPFLPFMYFFFAVGAWVKTVFEAMVGVPLWALAHLRIEGNGLPGDMAMNGYFLIFEIFVRPILTVFGLVASLAIFTALVRVLHEIFPLVTQNMTGFDATQDTGMQGLLYTGLLEMAGYEFKRDVIDEFFFTIIYTIIIYMLAMSCFKLIDQIPSSILRWMGAGVSTFSERGDEAVQGLIQYAAVGGMSVTGQAIGAMTTGAQGAGATVGSALAAVTGRNRGMTNLLGK